MKRQKLLVLVVVLGWFMRMGAMLEPESKSLKNKDFGDRSASQEGVGRDGAENTYDAVQVAIDGFDERLARQERDLNEATLFENNYSENNYDAVLSFVNLVQKRYYVIQRLQGAVEGLLSRYATLCGQESEKTRVQQRNFLQSDNLQRGCSQRGCSQRGCSLERELFAVRKSWQDCLAYKSIMTDKHVRELLIHLIVLYDALLKVCGKESGAFVLSTREIFQQPTLEKVFNAPRTFASEMSESDELSSKGKSSLRELAKVFSRRGLEELLDTVDVLAATSKRLFGSKPQWMTSVELPDFGDASFLTDEPTAASEPSDEVLFQGVEVFYKNDDFLINTTLRFYMIQRVTDSVEKLALLADSLLAQHKDFSGVYAQLPSTDILQSSLVRECVQKMRSECSLQPLLMLWDAIGSYRYIGDAHVVKEVLMIVVQVYQLLMKLLTPNQEKEEVSELEVLDLYNVISSLPLTDLLMLLDDFSQQTHAVVGVYQQGKIQGWKAVFKRYWWVPPVLLAGCASLYLRVKRYVSKPQYREHFVSGRFAPREGRL